MHPRIHELLQYLDGEHALLREAVDAIPAHLREQAPAPGRWSVAQVVEHLALIEGAVGRCIAGLVEQARAENVGPETETTPVAALLDTARVADRSYAIQAPDFVVPREGLDMETGWQRLEEARVTLRQALLAGDGLALGRVTAPHPVLGPLCVYQWTLAVGGHEARHRGQIEEAAQALAAAQA